MKNTYKSVILYALVTALMLVTFTSCSSNKIQVNTEQSENIYVANEDYQGYLELQTPIIKVDNGYCYINNYLLYFYDSEMKQSYILCDKVNCTHSDDTCTAYLSMMNYLPLQLGYYDNSIYIFGWDIDGANTFHNYLYQISLDNYKRQKAAFLFSSSGLSSNLFLLHRGYVYFTYGSSTMKERTETLYRTKLGETSKKSKAEPVYEFDGIGANIYGLTAYGNIVFFEAASYADTEGNGYNSKLISLNIHTTENKTILEESLGSYFVCDGKIYYEKGDNIVNSIDLSTNEESFFCNIDSPSYMSGDSNYLYFDNLRSRYINDNIIDREIMVFDKNGKKIGAVKPKNIDDECIFGGDDLLIFSSITDESSENQGQYYALDKNKITQPNHEFIDMN